MVIFLVVFIRFVLGGVLIIIFLVILISFFIFWGLVDFKFIIFIVIFVLIILWVIVWERRLL